MSNEKNILAEEQEVIAPVRKKEETMEAYKEEAPAIVDTTKNVKATHL